METTQKKAASFKGNGEAEAPYPLLKASDPPVG